MNNIITLKKMIYNKCIYHKRDMDATERTIVVMKDADILIKICDSTGDFDDTSEYQLLIRLLKNTRSLTMMVQEDFDKKRKLKILRKYYLILLILKLLLDIRQVANISAMLET